MRVVQRIGNAVDGEEVVELHKELVANMFNLRK